MVSKLDALPTSLNFNPVIIQLRKDAIEAPIDTSPASDSAPERLLDLVDLSDFGDPTSPVFVDGMLSNLGGWTPTEVAPNNVALVSSDGKIEVYITEDDETRIFQLWVNNVLFLKNHVNSTIRLSSQKSI